MFCMFWTVFCVVRTCLKLNPTCRLKKKRLSRRNKTAQDNLDVGKHKLKIQKDQGGSDQKTIYLDETHNSTCQITDLPNEILSSILRDLPPKQLLRSSIVCKRFKDIVESLQDNEALWMSYCQKEYKYDFEYARQRADDDMRNYDVYRELVRWKFIKKAEMLVDPYSLPYFDNNALGATLLENNVLAIHRYDGIEYWDIRCGMRMTAQPKIRGQFTSWAENKRARVLEKTISGVKHLHVLKKHKKKRFQKTTTLSDIKTFLLTDDTLYVLVDEHIIIIPLNDREFENMVINFQLPILNLKHSEEGLEIYTTDLSRFIWNDNKLERADITWAVFQVIKDENLFERCCWLQKHPLILCMLSGYTRNKVISIKHSNVLVFGTSWGNIYIFPAQEPKDINAKPFHVIRLTDHSDPIVSLDIQESHSGPKIIVTCRTKMFKIKFAHSIKTLLTFPWLDIAARPCNSCKWPYRISLKVWNPWQLF